MISETITKATGPQPIDISTSGLQEQECSQQFRELITPQCLTLLRLLPKILCPGSAFHGKQESPQQKEKKQWAQVAAREALIGSENIKEKKMLYSEAEFVHRSLGTSSLGGTRCFTGQHPEKPDLIPKSVLLQIKSRTR